MLIPAWQPGAALPALVDDLRRAGMDRILVVDDGSGPGFTTVFDKARRAGAKIVGHAANRGKGRALKTGFEHLLRQSEGVVTADADSQHTAEDIARIAAQLASHPKRCVLGVRSFAGAVPLRSRLGNTLTRQLFARLTGEALHDTQSGLRGFPTELLPELTALRGERYEYEMTVLAHLCRTGRRPLEVPIATVYIEGNLGSHFRPFRDTVRVGLALLRST